MTMKLNSLPKLFVLGLILTISAAGCRKTPVGVQKLPDYDKNKIGDANPSGPINPDAKPGEEIIPSVPIADPALRASWIRDREIFKSDTVHFDYDSSVVKSGEKAKVRHVADYMKSNPGHGLEIEGHCDERGTEEYNRSLGMRRALALRDELSKDGIDAKMIDITSYGKDRPADTADTPAAHAKNRRGEFLLETAPK
jgi:peptidoglycan-associated lipoprotein